MPVTCAQRHPSGQLSRAEFMGIPIATVVGVALHYGTLLIDKTGQLQSDPANISIILTRGRRFLGVGVLHRMGSDCRVCFYQPGRSVRFGPQTH